MTKAEISEAETKKMLPPRKRAPRRWLAQMHRLMSNRKRILKAKCAGEPLLRLAPSLLQRQLNVTFSNGCLEYGGNPRQRHRPSRLIASVEHHHDEHPTRIIAAVYLVSSASDRTTPFVL